MCPNEHLLIYFWKTPKRRIVRGFCIGIVVLNYLWVNEKLFLKKYFPKGGWEKSCLKMKRWRKIGPQMACGLGWGFCWAVIILRNAPTIVVFGREMLFLFGWGVSFLCLFSFLWGRIRSIVYVSFYLFNYHYSFTIIRVLRTLIIVHSHATAIDLVDSRRLALWASLLVVRLLRNLIDHWAAPAKIATLS